MLLDLSGGGNKYLPTDVVGKKQRVLPTCCVDEMTLCTLLSDIELRKMAVGEILVSI